MSAAPTKRQWLVLEVVSVAAYVWYVYSISRLTRDEDNYAVANFFYGISQVCYGVAQRFGTWGIRAERTAFRIVEEEKL